MGCMPRVLRPPLPPTHRNRSNARLHPLPAMLGVCNDLGATRALASLTSCIAAAVPRCAADDAENAGAYTSAVSHCAHMVHVLQSISSLATALLHPKDPSGLGRSGPGGLDAAAAAFYTPDRDAGLNWDAVTSALQLPPDPAIAETVAALGAACASGSAGSVAAFWAGLPPRQYWGVHLAVLCLHAAWDVKKPAAWRLHQAALTLRRRAVGPVAVAAESALKAWGFVGGLPDLLTAGLQDVAERVQGATLETAGDIAALAAASSLEVQAQALTRDVPLAWWSHATMVAGDDALLTAVARATKARVLSQVGDTWGARVADMMAAAMQQAGHEFRRIHAAKLESNEATEERQALRQWLQDAVAVLQRLRTAVDTEALVEVLATERVAPGTDTGIFGSA